MVLCDAVLRKLPGALGDERSAAEESFSAALEGNPEYPHYTRPAEYRGWRVPEVLLSGHHEQIERWRRERSRERGARRGRGRGGRPLSARRAWWRRDGGPRRSATIAARARPRARLGRPGRQGARLPYRHEQRHRNHRARAAAPRPQTSRRATA